MASLPHLYLTHEDYRMMVKGLNPEPAKHEINMVFEPVSALDRVTAHRVCDEAA